MNPEWSEAQIEALRVLSYRVETVEQLAARGALSPESAAASTGYYLAEASTVAGEPVSAATLALARALTESGQWWGFFDAVGILWVAVSALTLVALLWLTAIYVVPRILRWPRWSKELLAHGACVGVVVGAWTGLDGGGAVALAAVGALGMVPTVAYSLAARIRRPSIDRALRIFGAILAPAWAVIAWAFGSQVIGGMAVAALLATVGAVIFPGLEGLGRGGVMFVKRDGLPAAMLAAAALALGHRWLGPAAPAVAAIFAPGVQWLAGLTWFGGCMALASHRYKQPYERFVAAQALAVVSGAAAIGVGYVYGVPSLQEIGGTFLAAWALERFIELPWKRTNYAWMCLSLAALLFVGAQFMERHPAYFLGVGGVEALEAAL